MEQTAGSDSFRRKEEVNKRTVQKFFELVPQGKFKEGLQFFAPDCKTHNPYVGGSITNLIDAMIAANKEGTAKNLNAAFFVRHVLAEGDYVAAHTELFNEESNPEDGGLRQIHLFRFEGDKIAEYWDISQLVTPNLPNTAGAF